MTQITIRLPSSTKPDEYHDVTINIELKIVECDCIGFKFWNRCRHIRYLKSLVREYLRETPGFIAEE